MSELYRPLVARDSGETHRAATPLELLFDLVSVIAIATAAAGLHHAIAQAHAVQGVITFLMAFFAIWWAWMNYTWFASAYDNDDAVFRLLTMLIMGGSLAMAAGIGPMFTTGALTLVVIGYIVMRIGMIALWLRAAIHNPEHRATCVTYAWGTGVVQVFWIGFVLLKPTVPALAYGMFLGCALLELAVPAIAERKNPSPWHRHHIIERYGLLTIIVLGETLLAGAISLQQVADGALNLAFVRIAISSLIIVFSMWWLYFSGEDQLPSNDLNRALIWGYGHFVIFASGAAVGAGFAVLVDVVAGHGAVSLLVGDYAVAIPVAIFMLGLWLVRDRFCLTGKARFVLPVFAALVLLAPLTAIALEAIATLSAASVFVRSKLSQT